MISRTLRIKLILPLLFICMPTAFLSAEPVTVQLHFAITEATSAEPPAVIDNHFVLKYKGSRNYRFVGAAFKHEDFKIIHPFYVNTNGVYVLTYPLQEGMSKLEYRLVVDGLWMTDPQNPERTKDESGISLSYYLIPEKESLPESPRKEGGAIVFQYFGIPGQKVYVYGDFNNWDPYMYRMSEQPGTGGYTLKLRLGPGNYTYKYIVDGTSIPDPLNDQKKFDSFGKTASLLTIGYGY